MKATAGTGITTHKLYTRRPHLDLAEQVCVDALALAGTSKARVYKRLTSRLERIRIRKANPPKPPPSYSRNERAPRGSAFRLTRP